MAVLSAIFYCSKILFKALITAYPPAWTSFPGILSVPGNFPFLSDFTAASTLSARLGSYQSSLLIRQSAPLGHLRLCVSTVLRSIVSASLECFGKGNSRLCTVWCWFVLVLCWLEFLEIQHLVSVWLPCHWRKIYDPPKWIFRQSFSIVPRRDLRCSSGTCSSGMTILPIFLPFASLSRSRCQ